MMKILKRGKLLVFCALLCLLFATVASAAGSGDVASAVESTWTAADRHPALAAEIPRRRELRPAVFAISFHFFSSHSFCLSRLL